MIRCAPAIAAALLLASCDMLSGERTRDDDTRRAEGEVSGGTISDAMLPLDTATSTPPPAGASNSTGAADEEQDGGRDNAVANDESGPEAKAADDPAADPGASPAPAAGE